MTPEKIPIVHPMMVRSIIPTGVHTLFGGVMVMDKFDTEEIGMASERMGYDEDVVDCSNRIFEITNFLMMHDGPSLCAFPSRRWRNHRQGSEITSLPSFKHPLLYVGNPVRILKTNEGIVVIRLPEFRIKSGIEMGY